MPIEHISDSKLFHVRAVAELMYKRALDSTDDEKFAEEMYVLGLVHDVGYIHGAEVGGELMGCCGSNYAGAVSLHGDGELTDEQEILAIDLIQWCDMSVKPGGLRMTVSECLADIGKRYGLHSYQHAEAKKAADRLAAKGMI